jgi:hypothetical protein
MGHRRWSSARGQGASLASLLSLGTLAGLLAPAWGQGLESPEDFGRWLTNPSHCQLVRTSDQAPRQLQRRCRRVRLEQQLPGLLSLRLIEAGSDGRQVGQQLTLAGILKPGSRPMACRDGRCQPQWPLAMQVSALAERGFNLQQNPSHLPQAVLAQGTCRLDGEGFRCEVEGSDGLKWLAEATW